MKQKKKRKYINRISVFPLPFEYRNALWISLDLLDSLQVNLPRPTDRQLAYDLCRHLLRLQELRTTERLELAPQQVAVCSIALSRAVEHLGKDSCDLSQKDILHCRLLSELTEYAPYIRDLDQLFAQCLNDLLIPDKTARQ